MASKTERPARALKTTTLPNGLTVAYPSTEDEIRYIYEENFVDTQYLQNGISLKEGDTVIDVGANTGMFAIFAAQTVGERGRVLAFEPSPHTHACCEYNVKSHAQWYRGKAGKAAAPVESLMAACGDGTTDKLTLVEYDNLSVVNTVVPDHEAAVVILRSFIENQITEGKPVGNALQRALLCGGWWAIRSSITGPTVKWLIDKYARFMLLARHEVSCDMVTLSDLMRDKNLKKVNLLKVDVERAELIVLKGVKDEDWPRIEQVAVEVHEEMKEAVLDLLKNKGKFNNITVTAADQIIGPGLWMMHATRK